MKHRRRDKPIPKRQRRALREAERAEERLLDAMRHEDACELARGEEPTLSEMLSIDECNMRKGDS